MAVFTKKRHRKHENNVFGPILAFNHHSYQKPHSFSIRMDQWVFGKLNTRPKNGHILKCLAGKRKLLINIKKIISLTDQTSKLKNILRP